MPTVDDGPDPLPGPRPDPPRDERRRHLLRTALATAVGSLVDRADARAIDRRPNILLILADDWSWQGAEAIDRLHLHMPNFERLANDGVRFDNAFAASSSCTPSRGALLSGRWPWRLEEGANLVGSLPKHFPLYTEQLEAAGYHVGYARKGWGPGALEPAGRTRNPAGTAFADFDAFLAARTNGRPFCFWFGTHDPHRPYVGGSGIASGIDPADLTVPPYLPDRPEVRSDIADYRYDLERLDRETGELLDRIDRLGEADRTLVAMTGDNGWPFPRGKTTLYEAGWHVPLAIRWTDGFRGGRRSDALVSLIDLYATFLEVAGVRPSSDSDARSLLPLLRDPRRAASRDHVLGGLERHLDGRAIQGQGYPVRALRTATHLYLRNFEPTRWPAGDPPRSPVDTATLSNDGFAAFADIDPGPTKAWLVMHRDEPGVRPLYESAVGKRPPRELYDIAADPYCLRNLADDPDHRALAALLDRRLMHELRATGDPRALGHGDVFDRYPTHSDPGYGRPADF